MSDIRRLLDDGSGELEVELLRAAQEEAPPPAALWKAAAALGIGAAATGAMSLGSSTALASSATVAESAASAGAGAVAKVAALGAGSVAATKTAALGAGSGLLGGWSVSAALLGKPLVVGVVAGLAASAGVRYAGTRVETPVASQTGAANAVRARASESAPLSRGASRRPGVDPEVPLNAAAVPEAEEQPGAAARDAAATPSERRALAPSKPRPSSVVPGTRATPADPVPTAAFVAAEAVPEPSAAPPPQKVIEPGRSLAPEVALLDRARSALSARDGAGALRVLDAYASAPRSGVFEPEAKVLRIQALLQLGNRPGAARLARHFIQVHPESRHAKSLRTLADEAVER